MKNLLKALLILLILFTLTGCNEKELSIKNWPTNYPVYEGKGNIFEKDNKNIIIIKNVNSIDFDEYKTKIKDEYSGAIVNNETIYQGTNENKEMIIIEYNKDKKELTIKNS